MIIIKGGLRSRKNAEVASCVRLAKYVPPSCKERMHMSPSSQWNCPVNMVMKQQPAGRRPLIYLMVYKGKRGTVVIDVEGSEVWRVLVTHLVEHRYSTCPM